MESQNKQHHLQDQQGTIASNQNEITGRITKPSEEDNDIGKILYQLVKEHSSPVVDIIFDENHLHCT